MKKMLYTNLMVTTNEKLVIDTQKTNRKESNTKESQQTMIDKSKKRNRELQKQQYNK